MGVDSPGGGDFRMEPDIPEWGYKFHMNDVNAVVGLVNLKHVPDIISKCRENAKYYDQVCHHFLQPFFIARNLLTNKRLLNSRLELIFSRAGALREARKGPIRYPPQPPSEV